MPKKQVIKEAYIGPETKGIKSSGKGNKAHEGIYLVDMWDDDLMFDLDVGFSDSRNLDHLIKVKKIA